MPLFSRGPKLQTCTVFITPQQATSAQASLKEAKLSTDRMNTISWLFRYLPDWVKTLSDPNLDVQVVHNPADLLDRSRLVHVAIQRVSSISGISPDDIRKHKKIYMQYEEAYKALGSIPAHDAKGAVLIGDTEVDSSEYWPRVRFS